jgi:hypothetical protein
VSNKRRIFMVAFIIVSVQVVIARWVTEESMPKSCEEMASHAQRLCQAYTNQTCVEVFDQHLIACQQAQKEK